MNSLSTTTSTSPQILPDRGTADLIARFQNRLDREGRSWFLPALPTADERRAIEARRGDVRRSLRPISMVHADKERAALAITAMLTAWIHTGRADPKSTVAAYVMHLADLPLFAIEKACGDVARGYVDGLSPDFPPAAPRLHQLAMDACEKLSGEAATIDRILNAELRVEISEDERARVSARFKELAERMRVNTVEPEDQRRKAQIERRQKEAHERAILAEYAALGMEPVYAGDGIIVSPALLKVLGATVPPRKTEAA